jgi:hypothetical protein
MVQTEVTEKIKTHILSSVNLLKIVPFMRYCGEKSIAEQATDDSMGHAHCLLDN